MLRFISTGLLIVAAFAVSLNFSGGGGSKATAQTQQQQLVESISFQGNRRLNSDTLLYYIQTRTGDQFNQAQIERDLQSLLTLNLFDKAATRVLTTEGVRGGVNVIFEVTELPIIRDLQFKGLKAVQESDVLKAFRENKIGISKEAVFDPVKAQRSTRILRELLSAKGFPNAKVNVNREEVSATSVALTYNIEQGERSRLVKIEFDGNQAFKTGDLRKQLQLTKESGFFNFSRFKGTDILDRSKLQYDINKNMLPYMRSRGYLQARTGEPLIEGLGNRRTGFFLPLPFLSSKDDTLKVTIPISEGRQYRVGDVKISGNSIFSEQQIAAIIGLQKGEVVNGKQLSESLNETGLKKLYGSQGFIQFSAEPEPTFKDDPTDAKKGIADFNITVDEGKQFTLRRLEFTGNTFTRDNVLRREFILNEGDIYNDAAVDISTQRLDQTGYFDPIDKDKDKEIRTDEPNGLVDLLIRVKEKGRQQISFNGGVGGISGSFFGLEYSTNNLFGRGETLSFQVGTGNRQNQFVFSFTEPYFRDRPITVGFSLQALNQKFFGEGTALSQNIDALNGLTTSTGFLTTNSDNLFTRITYGASVFASAPLSEFYRKRQFTQFSRVGLSYQFSTTSVKDPAVNSTNSANAIPVIFSQSNIITSRITPTFVYDSRRFTGQGIDASGGKQITASLGLSGLGGDVRTYSPQLQYISFTPIRRKRSRNPEVFGFRILAATVGSFATTSKIRNSNSLSFIGGVPIYERFFLGDEYTIRGYSTRSVGPITGENDYITTRNVVVANNSIGTPVAGTILTSQQSAALAQLGTFTGASGANPLQYSRRVQFLGGDTQLLGNFEYRIPIFGPVTAAAFADIGTAFNLRKVGTQIVNTNFQSDAITLGGLVGTSINNLLLSSNNGLALQPSLANGLLLRGDGSVVTREEAGQMFASGINPLTGVPFNQPGSLFQEAFLRGDAQINQVYQINDSTFSSIKDFRSSLGVEFRVQIPIVNAPFRLIYAFNPNSHQFATVNGQQVFLGEKRQRFAFSVGRTF